MTKLPRDNVSMGEAIPVGHVTNTLPVIPGLVPGIHVLNPLEDVDGRDEEERLAESMS
jgi:hypothetical protein